MKPPGTTIPITGLPPLAQHPRCVGCGVKLRPLVEHVYAGHGKWTSRTFKGWDGYPRRAPLFCTLRCALDYAVLMHTRHGTRFVAGPSHRLTKP